MSFPKPTSEAFRLDVLSSLDEDSLYDLIRNKLVQQDLEWCKSIESMGFFDPFRSPIFQTYQKPSSQASKALELFEKCLTSQTTETMRMAPQIVLNNTIVIQDRVVAPTFKREFVQWASDLSKPWLNTTPVQREAFSGRLNGLGVYFHAMCASGAHDAVRDLMEAYPKELSQFCLTLDSLETLNRLKKKQPEGSEPIDKIWLLPMGTAYALGQKDVMQVLLDAGLSFDALFRLEHHGADEDVGVIHWHNLLPDPGSMDAQVWALQAAMQKEGANFSVTPAQGVPERFAKEAQSILDRPERLSFTVKAWSDAGAYDDNPDLSCLLAMENAQPEVLMRLLNPIKLEKALHLSAPPNEPKSPSQFVFDSIKPHLQMVEGTDLPGKKEWVLKNNNAINSAASCIHLVLDMASHLPNAKQWFETQPVASTLGQTVLQPVALFAQIGRVDLLSLYMEHGFDPHANVPGTPNSFVGWCESHNLDAKVVTALKAGAAKQKVNSIIDKIQSERGPLAPRSAV